MTKFVTLTLGVVDTLYMYDPRPAVDAIEAPDDVFAGWRRENGTWEPPNPSLDELRLVKLTAISKIAQAVLDAGAPVVGGLHVALDDGSRSDLIALAQTATNAMSGVLSWPDSYARGWISIENIRIPLVTPADGLALAASVGNFYAALVQHRRDLKDRALAAKDVAALDAINASAGWPLKDSVA